MNLDLLHSARFWQLFIIGMVAGLNVPLPNNSWVAGLSIAVGVWFGGSVVIGTIEKKP